MDELSQEGLNNRIRRYEERCRLLEEGFVKLGLRFLVPSQHRSQVLTALWLPEKISYGTLHDELKKAGFVIYAGQSSFSGKVFRISNLGDMSLEDIRRFLKELNRILKHR